MGTCPTSSERKPDLLFPKRKASIPSSWVDSVRNCGRAYTGTQFPGPGRQKKAYYICHGKNSYYKKCEIAKNIPLEDIEEYVWNECLTLINSPREALDELSATMEKQKEQQRDWKSELDLLERSLQDKDTEKQSILDLFRKGLITSKDVEQQLEKIQAEKETIEHQIEEIKTLMERERNIHRGYQSAEELLRSLQEKLSGEITFEVKREIVTTLVQQIVVYSRFVECDRLEASVSVEFIFSPIVDNTDKREYNNPGISLVRRKDLNVTRSNFYDPSLSTSAARIRNSRIEKNMAIQELADLVGLTYEAIN